MNYVQQLIKEICDDKKIEFDLVSKNWIMVLRKGNKVRYISGYKFGLNNQASSIICDDKYALYDTFKLLNIPIIEHKIIFKNYNKEDILEFSKKYNYNMVVKSNTGTCGLDMFHVTNKDELFIDIDKLLVKNHSISICPFYKIKNEYRTVILDGNIELFYGKKRPIVYGDGSKTIKGLLCEFNNNYFSKIEDKTLDIVLEKDKEYMYSWQHNLSKGSIPFEVKDKELISKVQSLATKAYNTLNMRFTSVDIIELETGELLILEINSGVMMENYAQIMKNGVKTVKKIYSKAIDLMFE